ncbi:16S rRNA processing protein RimM [bacterium]|nr:16S rRNA processing protein RimM [bacterium]
MERFVPIADVVKAVGLRGEVKLYPLLDFHAPILASAFLRWDDGEKAAMESARPAGTGVAVKPRGCTSRDEAERLVGRQLGFDRESYRDAAFPRPDDGLPFRYLDREVRTRDGELLGRVQEVRRYAAQVLLVIEREGREALIPAVDPIVEVDDAMEGPVVADPPEGLLDA